MRRITAFVLMWLPLTLLAGPQDTPSDGAALRERFLARVDEPLVRCAVRRLAARNERFDKEASLDVATTLDPSVGFQCECWPRTGPRLRAHARPRADPPRRGARGPGGRSGERGPDNRELRVRTGGVGRAPLARLLIRPGVRTSFSWTAPSS